LEFVRGTFGKEREFQRVFIVQLYIIVFPTLSNSGDIIAIGVIGPIDKDMRLIFLGCGISALILSGPDDSLLSDVYHILLQEPSMKQAYARGQISPATPGQNMTLFFFQKVH
jgi:hypothetical protein